MGRVRVGDVWAVPAGGKGKVKGLGVECAGSGVRLPEFKHWFFY